MWKISAGDNLIVQQHVKKSLFYIIYIREHISITNHNNNAGHKSL